jgi:hypothetical protein
MMLPFCMQRCPYKNFLAEQRINSYLTKNLLAFLY